MELDKRWNGIILLYREIDPMWGVNYWSFIGILCAIRLLKIREGYLICISDRGNSKKSIIFAYRIACKYILNCFWKHIYCKILKNLRVCLKYLDWIFDRNILKDAVVFHIPIPRDIKKIAFKSVFFWKVMTKGKLEVVWHSFW